MFIKIQCFSFLAFGSDGKAHLLLWKDALKRKIANKSTTKIQRKGCFPFMRVKALAAPSFLAILSVDSLHLPFIHRHSNMSNFLY
jgi:hypothetical protein